MLRYETFVPDNGSITLPPEFCGTEIIVVKKTTPLPENNEHWKHRKTLEELAEEQGVGPCTDPERLFDSLSFLWESKEEAEEFLRRRKQ
ncbi:MAG: hypothetical protein LBK82_09300 [Planctomycetaceae bacterium]|jgi:hypothetical protein|nr:hypothetical protein [Planctomycetaceae bacterium]